MKKWMAGLGVMLALTTPAMAWRPAGWVFANYPYMYDHASQDWYWFGVNNVQWANGFPPADGWKRLNEGPLARGWTWHVWPYAYHHPGRAWHFFSANGKQRCVNLRTGVWSVFGLPPAPAGMVVIPGGTNAGTDPDYGAYSLTVQRFYMDKYEVTKTRWDEVRDWAATRGYADLNTGDGKGADHPVQTVSWYSCVKWCNARSEKDERDPRYYTDEALTQVYRTGNVDEVFVKPAASGYGLPTEVEWMYAARGGVSGARFPWGTDTITHEQANYFSIDTYAYDISLTRGHHPTYAVGDPPYTAPVGTFPPNGYGLYEMAGNVYEWCWDWAPVGINRVLRGGMFNGYAENGCVIGWRSYTTPDVRAISFGFRTVARPAP
jgi:formylglycine-generating enzyme